MPIYEYQCQACGAHLEEIQKMSDPLLINCPHCGKPQLKRLISHTSFQLKGGGYYETDYKNPKKSNEQPSAEKSDATGAVKETKDSATAPKPATEKKD